MTLPNFLIIGAAKSGTSSLYMYLMQHPEIFMSPSKEPHFFSFDDQSKMTTGRVIQFMKRSRTLILIRLV